MNEVAAIRSGDSGVVVASSMSGLGVGVGPGLFAVGGAQPIRVVITQRVRTRTTNRALGFIFPPGRHGMAPV
jgi:hypothetical protein